MPTPITKTVRTSGGDYTTLAAAISGELIARPNLVTNDENLIIEVWDSTSESGADVTGFTTDATRDILITVPSAYRHDGTPGTGATISSSADARLLLVGDDYVTIQYLEFDHGYAGANAQQTLRCAGDNNVIHGCIVNNSGAASGNMRGIQQLGSNCRLSCTLALNYPASGAGIALSNANSVVCYNNVVKDCGLGWDLNNTAHVLTNNICFGCTSSYTETTNVTGTKNHADNAEAVTPPGTSPGTVDLVTGDFDDTANDDMRPLDTAAQVHEYGSDLSGTWTDGDGTADADITGTAFPASWNIGAFGTSTASDAVAPNLSLPTSASVDQTTVTLGATTDEDNGTAHAIITANGDESAPTNQEIIDGGAAEELFQLTDVTISATGAFTFAPFSGMAPGTTYGYAIVHEDVAGNEDAGSRVEGTFTTLAAFSGTATYSGSTIPADSVAFVTSGLDDTSSGAAFMTDSTASFTVDAFIDNIVSNVTDGSTATITDNDGTTITGTLSGGTNDNWDSGDHYQVLWDIAINDTFYFVETITIASETGTFKVYVENAAATEYTKVATVTITATGATDGNYTITMDTEGVPTLTPVVSSGVKGRRRRRVHRYYDLEREEYQEGIDYLAISEEDLD